MASISDSGSSATSPFTAHHEALADQIADYHSVGRVLEMRPYGSFPHQDIEVYSSPRVGSATVRSLTTREREILRHVAKGEMSRKIAADLRLSIRTVEFHRSNILRKTGAGSAEDVTRYAIQSGALPSEGR